MNIEIPDELAIELADAHVEAFSTLKVYDGPQRLINVVGKLLVYIPDPRAPEPIDIVDIPVTTLVLDPSTTPAPKRGKLTRHQREVFNDIDRMSRRLSGGERRYIWVKDEHVGSINACNRLIEKGWIEVDVTYGPRGGVRRSYRPIIDEGQ